MYHHKKSVTNILGNKMCIQKFVVVPQYQRNQNKKKQIRTEQKIKAEAEAEVGDGTGSKNILCRERTSSPLDHIHLYYLSKHSYKNHIPLYIDVISTKFNQTIHTSTYSWTTSLILSLLKAPALAMGPLFPTLRLLHLPTRFPMATTFHQIMSISTPMTTLTYSNLSGSIWI